MAAEPCTATVGRAAGILLGNGRVETRVPATCKEGWPTAIFRLLAKKLRFKTYFGFRKFPSVRHPENWLIRVNKFIF